ncbi:Cys-tRNA(Pro) deacylase [Suttonella sp. R2A3]|uniref:Cys-tRNA(Pro) deacylase n=1 Tax=Suttonella sp. R2A3 TaxID=2908648 RepID=UPI001F33EE64|nr:Cys-tRNA(Pro) deacylase [Suttonella sp. R2A3]UJF23691.1 Cys-tRNA(Pro) deacylase [Suttonella sp. R2A3]
MTPAIDLCRAQGVTITIHEFTHDPSNRHFGEEAASALGVDAAQVFKTLMVSAGAQQFALAIVPVSGSLDLKKMASAMGVKKISLAEAKTAQSRSGYLLGGMSPLAHKRPCALYLDQQAKNYHTIFVSGGRRGLDIELTPQDLLTLSEGVWADIAQ